jgi:hypothetical protein
MLAIPATGWSQSLFSESLVGAGNYGYYDNWVSSNWVGDDTPVSADWSYSFSGLDGSGNEQTMSFSGETVSQSNYGQLHVYTAGSLQNSYYNSSNPIWYNNVTTNPNGSPDNMASLGFAVFNDTLQFGGNLVDGYQAVYIFHVDGTNSGTGYLADLAVNVTDDPSQSFFDFSPGYSSENWATTPFQVNGQNGQDIDIQFSDQVVFNTPYQTDGDNYSGTSDFSETLTLAGIELVDANGNPFSGWTVTSASGTQYRQIESTPGPAAALPFLVAVPGIVRRKFRK